MFWTFEGATYLRKMTRIVLQHVLSFKYDFIFAQNMYGGMKFFECWIFFPFYDILGMDRYGTSTMHRPFWGILWIPTAPAQKEKHSSPKEGQKRQLQNWRSLDGETISIYRTVRFHGFWCGHAGRNKFPCPLNCDVSHRRTNQKHNLQ